MLSLIIPTYNERLNIARVIRRVTSTLGMIADDFEVIIVDDDSPDKTWEVAESLSKENVHVKTIRRLGERGLATAVVAGWKEAKGDILGVMDGDLQHRPETLKHLVHAILNTPADIVIASRHVAHGGVSEWSLVRRLISWGATCLATLVVPGVLRNVRDPMSGYFLLRKSVLQSARLNPTGYKILLEVLAKGSYRTVQEVPYIFEERKEGSSKLGARQYGEYLLHLARLAKETGELVRFARFCTIGFLGVFVNQAVLWFFTEVENLYYVHSSIIAVEVAIIANFLLNDRWTFRDHVKQSRNSQFFRRLVKFNVICAVGGALNTVALWVFTELFRVNYLSSNLIGVGISAAWNYFINANITWGIQAQRQTVEILHEFPAREVTPRKLVDEKKSAL